jgi:hypothetical protein
MEKIIADLAALIQQMQQHNDSIKLALEENISLARDLALWKP